MKFEKQGDAYFIHCEEKEEFGDGYIGDLIKDGDGYFCFVPISAHFLTCGDLKMIAKKISDLNIG